jgi:hypothetical protein
LSTADTAVFTKTGVQQLLLYSVTWGLMLRKAYSAVLRKSGAHQITLYSTDMAYKDEYSTSCCTQENWSTAASAVL